ncbi:GTP binding domain [Dillenia turbinata]|uniref:GTP binding domain n=1 Tax=Dillenia turbinata TaxID=194707 RepID=A0AAN8VNS8_9MAGN
MVSVLTHSASIHLASQKLCLLPSSQIQSIHNHKLRFQTRRRKRNLTVTSSQSQQQQQQQQEPQDFKPRTLFPGGFKRPEIKIPNLVLQLNADEVLLDNSVVDAIDQAVSKHVGIVILNGGDGSGGKLYEVACLLKSVIRDRAYLMISERVDIAAAVNASGVVLSDQGLPAIVARNTMMGSKSESVVLPLVARNVNSASNAINASRLEGADILIYAITDEVCAEAFVNCVTKDVRIPIFVRMTSWGTVFREDTFSIEASKLLRSGASGLVISFQDLNLVSDNTLNQLFYNVHSMGKRNLEELKSLDKFNMLDTTNGFSGKKNAAGFTKLEDREKQFIERERSVLLEAINVVQKAAPLMEEVSLLMDAISQLDEPFLLVIVGEFNSGKSTVINALLGKKYLEDGVIPTTNEITFLRYSKLDSEEQQRCERHPDGQLICYIPAPILKEMNIVDTPGTNVILQRQQRLTEEFVPRADLLLFVISADRPLTESEVAFLRYTQQWKKKVVFVLNKADLYQNARELEEAIRFIKENTSKLLNTEHVTLYPVSARTALATKLSASSDAVEKIIESSISTSQGSHSFEELETFLYSFLDGSTSTGMERLKLKLETPVSIAERLLSACQTLVRQEYRYAKHDLTSIEELMSSVKQYAVKMESESLSRRRQVLSLIESTKSRVLKLIESTVRLSNLDIATSYVFKGGNSSSLPATSRIENEIIGPALSDAQKLLVDYVTWLQSSNASEGKMYNESFEKKWPSVVHRHSEVQLKTSELLRKADELSVKAVENFSASAASKLFDQEIREVFLGAFGGLGAAGLSASLLTSVLQTTLEDLLALILCSTGGLLAMSNFPARRQKVIDKVKRSADALASDLEEAMQKDLSESIANLEAFIKILGKPYQDAAQEKLDRLSGMQDELINVEKKLQKLQIEIQNLHML